MSKTKKPSVFLDRDGVVNVDKGYVYRIDDFDWISGSREAIQYFKNRRYHVFIVTNQSGITRGMYSEEDVKNLHQYINKELKKMNTHIDDFFYSPYHPEIKNDKYKNLAHLRKPNTGMLELANDKWNIDKSQSLMIGDKQSDLVCAKRFGIHGFLFKENNLLDFVKKINF